MRLANAEAQAQATHLMRESVSCIFETVPAAKLDAISKPARRPHGRGLHVE